MKKRNREILRGLLLSMVLLNAATFVHAQEAKKTAQQVKVFQLLFADSFSPRK